MIRLLTLPLLLGVAVVVVGCATAAADWSPASSGEYDGRYEGNARGYDGGGADAPMAVAESAAAPMDALDVVGGAVSNFFSSDEETKKAEAPPGPPPPPKAPPLPTTEPPKDEPKTAPKTEEAAKRLVIYTGSMSLMVPVAAAAADEFIEKVNGLGGYLQSRSATTVTVRVPAGSFFSVLEGLRKSGTVTDEQVNAQDVTKKVFDIELRLQTAEESRKRLVEILKAATKIEDILRIETEIRRLTDEIEGMKGELRNLGDQVAFSTLTVSFYANAPAPRPYPDRTRSRFEWINQIGVEQVLYGF